MNWKKKLKKYKYPRCEVENKTSYPTPEAARKGMTMIWAVDPMVSLKDLETDLHVYPEPCPHCQGYHVGHWKYYRIQGHPVG